MSKKETAVAVVEAEEKGLALLDSMAPEYDSGFEELTSDDVSQPFLVIRHTALVDPNDEEKILCPAGAFSNSLSGRNYGRSLKVVFLRVEKRWVEWKAQGGDFVGKYTEAEAKEKGKFHHQDADGIKWFTEEGHNLNLTYYYYVVLPEYPEDGMMIFSLKTTGLKHARKINSNVNNTYNAQGRKLPPPANIWQMTSKKNTDPNGNPYYQIGEGKKTNFEHVERTGEELITRLIGPALQVLATMDTSEIIEAQEPAASNPPASGDEEEGQWD